MRAERSQHRGVVFAHATHEPSFAISCKIMVFTQHQRAKMGPFRLVPDGFGRRSIEILYDPALGRAAKAGLGLRLCRLSSACYAAEQGHRLPVISLNRCVSNSSEVTDIQSFHASNPTAARPAFPCWQGRTGKIPGFGEVTSRARHDADRIDFLSRRRMGVFRLPIAPRDDDFVETRHPPAGSHRGSGRSMAPRPAGPLRTPRVVLPGPATRRAATAPTSGSHASWRSRNGCGCGRRDRRRTTRWAPP